MCWRGLTEWCNKLNIICVARETDPLPGKARSDKFRLKQALWAENDTEIRTELDKLNKVRKIEMPSNN